MNRDISAPHATPDSAPSRLPPTPPAQRNTLAFSKFTVGTGSHRQETMEALRTWQTPRKNGGARVHHAHRGSGKTDFPGRGKAARRQVAELERSTNASR